MNKNSFEFKCSFKFILNDFIFFTWPEILLEYFIRHSHSRMKLKYTSRQLGNLHFSNFFFKDFSHHLLFFARSRIIFSKNSSRIAIAHYVKSHSFKWEFEAPVFNIFIINNC